MDKKILGFLWAMLGVIVGICLVGIVHCGGYGKGQEPADVVRDTVIDTIPYYMPVPKEGAAIYPCGHTTGRKLYTKRCGRCA